MAGKLERLERYRTDLDIQEGLKYEDFRVSLICMNKKRREFEGLRTCSLRVVFDSRQFGGSVRGHLMGQSQECSLRQLRAGTAL